MPGPQTVSSADVVIRAFEQEDVARVLDLLRGGFGTWPSDMDAVEPSEFFRWKHMESPFGSSLLLVAEAEGELVGFAAWLRWRLVSGNRTLEALRGVDFVVDPLHRGRGVPVSLIRTASERFPDQVALTFSNPNERSRSGAAKSGRHHAGTLRRFVRLGHPLRGLVRARFGQEPGSRQEPQVEAETAERILSDGTAVSSLLANVDPPGDRLVTARDLDYLRWRYGRFQAYRAVRADAGGEIAGIAIFRQRCRGSWPATRVCELIVPRGRSEIARRLLRSVRNAAPAAFVTCAFPSRREAARHWFVQAPGGSRLVVHPLRADLRPDPRQLSSWELSIGDREL